MDDDTRRRIEQECAALVIAATHHGDHREIDEVVALFAADCSWFRGGRAYQGLDGVRASFAAQSATAVTRHMNGGTFVTVQDEDHASSVTYYLALIADTGTADPEPPLPLVPFSSGEWHDTFVRTAEGWRFSSRRTKRIFQGAAPHP
jgi:hypothetical protein